MDSVPHPRQRWSLTPGAFDALLARLSGDREEAARQFEEHRRYLISLLTYAGAPDPEHLADMTLDRAAKRLAEGEVIENIRAWLRGASRMVLLESRTAQWRESNAAAAATIPATIPMDQPGEDADNDHRLLDECLGQLTADNRRLIEDYYQPQAGSLAQARQRLALRLGVSGESLRTKALRVRKTLEECLRRRRARLGKD